MNKALPVQRFVAFALMLTAIVTAAPTGWASDSSLPRSCEPATFEAVAGKLSCSFWCVGNGIVQAVLSGENVKIAGVCGGANASCTSLVINCSDSDDGPGPIVNPALVRGTCTVSPSLAAGVAFRSICNG